MNSSIKMSVVSATLGALLAGAIFVSMAQTTVSTPTRIQYMPHPRDMVQIREGTPYTVPTGRIFALTALGVVTLNGGNTTTGVLSVNGQQELEAGVYAAFGQSGGSAFANVSSMSQEPTGFTVPAGSTITVSPAGGRAWGYLVNQ